jgi:hypothetical protein
MEGVTGWYVILGVALLLIALVLRYSIYTILVRQNRWLPAKAGSTATFVSGIVFGAGILLLVCKYLFFSDLNQWI